MRTAMALACLTAACCVPFLALVMSLIGSLLTIGTAIILPVAIHLKIFKASASSVLGPARGLSLTSKWISTIWSQTRCAHKDAVWWCDSEIDGPPGF